jgi:DNA helicase HerA-like ATPase
MSRTVPEVRLALAGDFALPLTAVTETFAILGKRGSGKTSTAVVLAEELIGAGQPVVVLDPTGVWWGLRADVAGAPSGLPVVIVGGEHGDLPLSETDGRALAQLLVAERQSAVIDLSGMSKTAARRLVADFCEDLYRYCREPLHLIVDEADLFAPQRLPADMTRLLGAMDDVVRRGRAHGLGCTLISQRPAVLNKDVLGQAEVLVTMRMTSPRDVAGDRHRLGLVAWVARGSAARRRPSPAHLRLLGDPQARRAAGSSEPRRPAGRGRPARATGRARGSAREPGSQAPGCRVSNSRPG